MFRRTRRVPSTAHSCSLVRRLVLSAMAGSPSQSKSMALTPKMVHLRSIAPAKALATRASRRPASTSLATTVASGAASYRPRHPRARTRPSGRRPWLLAWRLRTQSSSPPSAARRSRLAPHQSVSAHRHRMRKAPSRISPSEDPEAAALFGKKRTRIIYGQNPANYTPGGSRMPK